MTGDAHWLCKCLFAETMDWGLGLQLIHIGHRLWAFSLPSAESQNMVSGLGVTPWEKGKTSCLENVIGKTGRIWRSPDSDKNSKLYPMTRPGSCIWAPACTITSGVHNSPKEGCDWLKSLSFHSYADLRGLRWGPVPQSIGVSKPDSIWPCQMKDL